jgi:hypothetical protein
MLQKAYSMAWFGRIWYYENNNEITEVTMSSRFLHHRLVAISVLTGALMLPILGCSSDKGDEDADTDVQVEDMPQDMGEDTAADPADVQDVPVEDTAGDPAPEDVQTDEESDVAHEDVPPPPPSELLLFDGDDRQFTYDDSGFHVLINPGDSIPADNWLDPVDYYNGEFQIRYVINGPSDQAAGVLQVCIWTMGDDGDGRNYFPESCGAQIPHEGVGEYLNSTVPDRLSPESWWKNEGVPLDFTHPERFLIRVVLRGESGCNVTRYDVSGACWDEWPLYENMNFRVTIVMVPAGETFSGWDSYP